MAEAAALKLNLALDLQFFRQQLQKAQTIAASEFSPSLNIRFNKDSIKREVNALQRLLNQRKFDVRLEVNDTSVTVATANLARLNKSIATFRQSQITKPLVIKVKYEEEGLPGGITGQTRAQKKAASKAAAAISGSFIDQASYKDLQQFYRLAKAAQMPFEELKRGAASSANELRRVLKSAFIGAGGNVKTGLKQGLTDASSDLSKIVSGISKDILNTFKKELGIASPSKKTEEIGKDTAKGFDVGFGEESEKVEQNVRKNIKEIFAEARAEAKRGKAQLQAELAGWTIASMLGWTGKGAQSAGISELIDKTRKDVRTLKQLQSLIGSAGFMAGLFPQEQKKTGISELVDKTRQDVRTLKQLQALIGSTGFMAGLFPQEQKKTGISDLIKQTRQDLVALKQLQFMFASTGFMAGLFPQEQKKSSIKPLIAQIRDQVRAEARAALPPVKASATGFASNLRPLRGTGLAPGSFFADRSAGNLQDMLKQMASYTKNPRAASLMLRQLPESRITTDLLGTASKQARFFDEVPSAREAQKSIKGFDPLLKAIATSFADYTRGLSPTNPWVGRIGSGIKDIIAKATESATRQLALPAAGQSSAGRMAQRTMSVLPPLRAPEIEKDRTDYYIKQARRTLGLPIGPSSPYARNPWAGATTVPPRRNYFTQTSQLALPGGPVTPRAKSSAASIRVSIAKRQAALNAELDKLVAAVVDRLKSRLRAETNQLKSARSNLLLPSADQRIAGLLPAAGASQSNKWQARIQQAYERSAARGAAVMAQSAGAKASSFVSAKEDSVATVSRVNNQFSGLISKIRDAGSAIRSELFPSFGDLRKQLIEERRRVSVAGESRGGILAGGFLGKDGNFNSYRGRFPTHGMMTPSGMTSDELFRRQHATRLSAHGGNVLNTFVNRSGVFSHYGFPMAPMAGPSSPLGKITAQSSMFAGGGAGGFGGGAGGFGGGAGGFGGGAGNPPGGGPSAWPGGPRRNPVQRFGRGMMQVQIGQLPNLPGVETVRELRNELTFATKQLVLFGTVYKGLAFLQNFPRQVIASVAALQSYQNSLTAVSGSSEAFAINNEYVLGLVEKYNIPLDTARQGFVKLYASMAPVGFTGTEIRDLFDAVSKGAATFGMSADKVDRVIYAFGQMASKGQVMSEELKGQLGDVLPGAVAIFAEAAGFKGPAAIAQFSKALEAGEYKGAKMRELLLNVKDVMNKEFGPGAEGAARTFQGALNRMQNSVKFLYEAFAPVATKFLNSFTIPVTNGLKIVTEGFNQFFTGIEAPSSGGREFAAQLEALRPAFKGIANNVISLRPQLQQLGETFLGIAKIFIQIAGNPIIGFLLRTYAAILPLQIAFNLLRLGALIPLIGSFVQFIGTIPLLVTRFGVLIAATRGYNAAVAQGVAPQLAMRVALASTGLSAQQAALGFKAASVAVGALRIALGAGLLIGIGLIIQRFAEMKSALDGIAGAARGVSSSLASMSRSGDVAGIKQAAIDLRSELKTFQEIRKLQGESFGKSEADRIKSLGLGGYLTKSVFGEKYVINDFLRFSEVVDTKIKKLRENLAEIPQKLSEAETRNKRVEDQRRKDEEASRKAAAAAGAEEDKKGKKVGATTYDAGAISNLANDQIQILKDLLTGNFDDIMSQIELKFGRGAGVFQPFVDFYAKLQDFNKKVAEGQLQLQELVAQNMGQELKAVNTANRNAAKELKAGAAGGLTGGGQADASRGRSTGPHLHAQLVKSLGTSLEKMVDAALNFSGRTASSFGLGRGAASHGYPGRDYYTPQGTPFTLNPGWTAQDMGVQGALGRGMRVSGPMGTFELGHLAGVSGAGQAGQKIAPSPAEVAAVNQQQLIARRKAIAASLKKDSAELYNALLELNDLDITSTANQQLFDLTETLKRVKREAQDTWDSLLPESAISDVIKNGRALERAIEDIQTKFRDIEKQIAQSLSGQEITKVLGSAEFLKSDAVKSLQQQLTALGLPADTVAKAFAEGARSGANLADVIQRLKELLPQLAAEQLKVIQLQEKLRKEFDIPIAIQKAQAEGLSAFGIPSTAQDNEIRRLEIKKQLAQAQAALDEATKKGQTNEIELQQKVIEGLKMQQLATIEILPGVATLGQAMELAFQPAVDAFSDFVMGTKTAGEAFREFAYDVISGLAKMAAQAATMMIFKQVLGGVGGLFGFDFGALFANGGTAKGGFKAFANGGIAPGGIKFRAFAGGGTVSGPTLGLVGEGRYNEAIVPLPDGKSIPVVVKGAGNKGGDNFSVNVSVDATGSKVQGDSEKAGQLGNVLSSAIQAELLKQKRPGGLLA